MDDDEKPFGDGIVKHHSECENPDCKLVLQPVSTLSCKWAKGTGWKPNPARCKENEG